VQGRKEVNREDERVRRKGKKMGKKAPVRFCFRFILREGQ